MKLPQWLAWLNSKEKILQIQDGQPVPEVGDIWEGHGTARGIQVRIDEILGLETRKDGKRYLTIHGERLS